MIHLLKLLFFIVCLLGLANVILAFLVYKQRNEALYLYQFFLLATIFLYCLSQFIILYSFFERMISGQSLQALFDSFLMSPLLYLAFSYTCRLAGVTPPKFVNILLIAWVLLYPVVCLIWIWRGVAVVHETIYVYSPFCILFVIAFILLRHYSRIVDPLHKKFVRHILLLIACFVPLLVLESLAHQYLQSLYYSYPVTQLFFLVFSLINLAFLIRALLGTSHQAGHPTPEIPTWFAERYGLTRREREVLSLLRMRNSNREIAGRLFISIPTVKYHIQNIFAKIGVNSRLDLQRYLDNLPF